MNDWQRVRAKAEALLTNEQRSVLSRVRAQRRLLHRWNESDRDRVPAGSPEGGQFAPGGGGGGGGGGARPKVSEPSGGGLFGRKPAKASAKATAAVNKAVNSMPAKHAALLKDVKVHVYGSSNDVKMGRDAGFTNVYDKARNTISVAETLPPGHAAPGSTGFVASVEHITMQTLGSALDDKLNGAGSRAMADAFRSERGPLTPREAAAGQWFLGNDVHEGQHRMFAELYSVAHNPDNSYKEYFGTMTRERAAKVFAPELAKIKAM